MNRKLSIINEAEFFHNIGRKYRLKEIFPYISGESTFALIETVKEKEGAGRKIG